MVSSISSPIAASLPSNQVAKSRRHNLLDLPIDVGPKILNYLRFDSFLNLLVVSKSFQFYFTQIFASRFNWNKSIKASVIQSLFQRSINSSFEPVRFRVSPIVHSVRSFYIDNFENFQYCVTQLNSRLISAVSIRGCTQDQLNFIAEHCPNLEELTAPESTFRIIPEALRLSLKKVSIPYSEEIEEIDLPKAEEININGCISLTTIRAPQATFLRIGECTQEEIELIAKYCPGIKKLETYGSDFNTIPESWKHTINEITLEGSGSIHKLDLPNATFIMLKDSRVANLNVPKAIDITCHDSILGTIHAEHPRTTEYYNVQFSQLDHLPKAQKYIFSTCAGITNLSLLTAEEVCCYACENLSVLNAPQATSIECSECPDLIALNAPQATSIDCIECPDLKILNALQATSIHCNGCDNLTILKAPEARSIFCIDCTNLKYIDTIPEVTITIEGCPSLIPSQMRKAVTDKIAGFLLSRKMPEGTPLVSWQERIATIAKKFETKLFNDTTNRENYERYAGEDSSLLIEYMNSFVRNYKRSVQNHTPERPSLN